MATTLTALRRAYKDTGSTTDSQCIRIELQDGTTVLRYTDSHLNLTTSLTNTQGTEVPIDPVTYSSVMGFDISAVGGSSNTPGEVDLEGILGALGYNREQIVQGIFENARIYVFLTNYERPVEDEEPLFTGFWGETTLTDGRYVTRFVSLLSVFGLDTSRVISQFCDAGLGSVRCGVKMVPGDRLDSISPSAVFDPLTSVGTVPLVWYDFNDEASVTVNGSNRIERVLNKGNSPDSAALLPLSTSNRPLASTINGLDAISFTSFSNYLTNSSEDSFVHSGVDQPLVSGSGALDMFIVAHNSVGLTSFTLIGDASVSNNGWGPIATQGSADPLLSPLSANADFLRVYDYKLDRLLTRGDLYTAFANPAAIMANSLSDLRSEVVGSGSSLSSIIIGEILVYPQLRNEERKLIMEHLNRKWGVSVGGRDSIPEGPLDHDAATRDLISVTGIDYVWFEGFGSGEILPTPPAFDSTLDSITFDLDVFWKAVPARIIELTCVAGGGITGTVPVNEILPIDFLDIYQNGSLAFLTGPNAGTSFTIMGNTTSEFTLNQPTLIPVTAGDQIRITIACDKTRSTCNDTFANGTNFQGFHDLPNKRNIFKIGEK